MKLQGSFKDRDNKVIEVIINNPEAGDGTIIIGDSETKNVFFSADPLEVETNCDSTFEPILTKSGKLTLLTKIYLGDILWAASFNTVTITINKDNTCVFYGYVIPSSYSQSYAYEYEELTVNFTDCLSTLQYKHLSDGIGNTWESEKANSTAKSFMTYLQQFITEGEIVYDGSKKIGNKSALDAIGLGETVFLGDNPDSEMTAEDIVKEILQYLNLHIIQEGRQFHIFDWNTVKNGTVVPVTMNMASSDSTEISTDEVYNQIRVKCETMPIETLAESPMDSGTTNSFYYNKQKFCTEYVALGEGKSAHDAFSAMLNNQPYINSDYVAGEAFWQNDWYLQSIYNSNWSFNIPNSVFESDSSNIFINQYKVADYLKWHDYTAAMFKMGYTQTKNKVIDNNVTGAVSTNSYIYISINGQNKNDPNESKLHALNSAPLMKYVGTGGASAFSPVDEGTKNYIVFSGKIKLQPNTLYSPTSVSGNTVVVDSGPGHGTVPYYTSKNDDGCLYTRRYWQAKYPKDEPTTNLQPAPLASLQPYMDDNDYKGGTFQWEGHDQQLVYDNPEHKDSIYVLQVLECRLKIGDYYCVETYDSNGFPKFEWLTYDECPTLTDDYGNTYKKNTFQLGPNPAIGDQLLNKEWDLANTVDNTMNIEATGTAIPVPYMPQISGDVTFEIIAPVNLQWSQYVYRHGSFWRGSKDGMTTIPLLRYVDNIIIKDFTCKIYSDNGQRVVMQDKDLIYASDEVHEFIKKKDDITFKINTALTTSEAAEKQVNNTVNYSTAMAMDGVTPITVIKDTTTNQTDKPERLYVDAYYKEYSKPKIIVETDVHDSAYIDAFNTYTFNYFGGKKFYPMALRYNYGSGTVHMKLKEA